MGHSPQFFGTDGIRGAAGRYPLDPSTVWRIGRALGEVLETTVETRPVQVLIGEDTRESSAGISRCLAAGLRATGVEVLYAGVMTTPGIAFLTHHHAFSAGVAVSASHNAYSDNGIKILSAQGMKLSANLENEIERRVLQGAPSEWDGSVPDLERSPELVKNYLDFLQELVPRGVDFSKYRVVVDCAHGAASGIVPDLLKRLGIKAGLLNAQPDGRNINSSCGSLYPERMAEATRGSKASLGVAFDGDADRAIFATSQGRIADGDHVLFAFAPFLKARGTLKGDAVVGTVMSNVALELALAREGIVLKRTAVGDKYVLEEMLRSGINLGGEPSGHVIFADFSLAGDGIMTLLLTLRLLAETGESFNRLVSGLKQFPQIIRNVRVREKPPLESVRQVAMAIEEGRREFGERGRIVVRYSGTEPVARIMVEGEPAEAVERHAARIASIIQCLLGTK